MLRLLGPALFVLVATTLGCSSQPPASQKDKQVVPPPSQAADETSPTRSEEPVVEEATKSKVNQAGIESDLHDIVDAVGVVSEDGLNARFTFTTFPITPQQREAFSVLGAREIVRTDKPYVEIDVRTFEKPGIEGQVWAVQFWDFDETMGSYQSGPSETNSIKGELKPGSMVTFKLDEHRKPPRLSYVHHCVLDRKITLTAATKSSIGDETLDGTADISEEGYPDEVTNLGRHQFAGKYLREPAENGWHRGTLTIQPYAALKLSSPRPGRFKWKNEAGVTWPLSGNVDEGRLDAKPGSPYFDSHAKIGRSFRIKTKKLGDGRMVVAGFHFLHDYFKRVEPDYQKLEPTAFVSCDLNTVLTFLIDQKRRVPGLPFDPSSDPTQTLANFKLGRVDLFLLNAEGEFTVPLVFIPDAEKKVLRQFKEYPSLTKTSADGGVTLDWKTVMGEAPPYHVRDFELRHVGDRLVVSTPQIIDRLEKGNLNPYESPVAASLQKLNAADSTIAFAFDNPSAKSMWNLSNNSLLAYLESSASVHRAIASPKPIIREPLSTLLPSLRTTERLAVAFNFDKDQPRRLSYSQLFQDAESCIAEAVAIEKKPTKDVLPDLRQLLHEGAHGDGLDKKVETSNRELRVSLTWPTKLDDVIVGRPYEYCRELADLNGWAAYSTPAHLGPPQYAAMPTISEESDIENTRETWRDALVRSIVFEEHRETFSKSLRFQVALPDVPNAALTEYFYDVRSITSRKGEDVRLGARPMFAEGNFHAERGLEITYQDIDKAALGKARVQYELKYPTKVAWFKFTKSKRDEWRQTRGPFAVKITAIEQGTIKFAFHTPNGETHASIFAFDGAGKCLKGGGGYRSFKAACTTFSGDIDRIWIAIPVEIEKLTTTIDLDLTSLQNGESPGTP